MFCSNCGKTIRPEDDACQHCGASLGEGRFYGNTYTSSQVRLPVEALHEAPEGGMIAYTRTNYMSYDNQPQDDVYSNTTYRPLLSDEEDMTRIEAEEAARKAAEEEAARAAEEAARAEAEAQANAEQAEAAPDAEADMPEEEQPAAEEEITEEEPAEDIEDAAEDIPEVSTSPLPPLKKAAISPRVLSYMEEMENREQRRANKSSSGLRLPSFLKKKVRPVEEEELPEEEDVLAAGESAEESYEEADAYEPEAEADYAEETDAAGNDSEEDYSDEAYSDEEEAAEEYAGEDYSGEDYEDADPEEYVADESGDDFESYEDADYADDESEEGEKPKFSLNFDFKVLLENKILKISVAAVLIVAVVIAGIVWLSFVSAKRPKIVDITNSTYFEGIELLKASITEEYRTEMKETYLVNTSAANASFSADLQALNALLPAEPKPNDPLFVNTLTIIQDSIADAIKADADAELKGEDRTEASTRDWQAIQNAVTLMEEATSAGQLAVIVGDLESVVAPTPSPTPVPTKAEYPTLKNGMMDSVQVQVMQNRLINLGFLSGEPDGDFGNGTEEAVKAFQRAAGLTASGIADHATQEAMFDDNAPRVNSTVSSTAAPASPDAAPAG